MYIKARDGYSKKTSVNFVLDNLASLIANTALCSYIHIPNIPPTISGTNDIGTPSSSRIKMPKMQQAHIIKPVKTWEFQRKSNLGLVTLHTQNLQLLWFKPQ